MAICYDADVDENKFYQWYSSYCSQKTVGDGSIGFKSIDDKGFTFSNNIAGTNVKYIAISN